MTDARVPAKPALEGLEEKWGQSWEAAQTYSFNREGATRECVYSIDTPPPTASVRCTSDTFSATPTPTWWPVSSE